MIQPVPRKAISSSGDVVAPPEWRGQWLVAKDLGAPGISALSEQQAHAMLGERVVIADGWAQFAGETCNHATYEVKTQTREDFLADYRLTPVQLPLRGKQVHTLVASCAGGPFHDLSRVDNGCVVLVWEGHFFQLGKGVSKPKQFCTTPNSQ